MYSADNTLRLEFDVLSDFQSSHRSPGSENFSHLLRSEKQSKACFDLPGDRNPMMIAFDNRRT